MPSDAPRTVGAAMPLCFIEPQDAIRVIAGSVGREARRQLLGELVRAWVDEIPESELASHYAKAVADLDEHDLSMLAAWHASMEVGTPLANKDFLVGAFKSLGDNRREALKIAAGLRGEDAFAPAWPRSRRWRACCRGCRASARRSCWPSAWSSTSGTGWAQRTRASSSAIACSVSRKWMPCMPASRAARDVDLDVVDERAVPGRQPRRDSVSA